MKFNLARRRENRVDPFDNPREIAQTTRTMILDAEEQIQGPKAGHRRLEAVAVALAAVIDIPILPEALELVIARVIVQVVFGTFDDIAQAVRERAAKRRTVGGAGAGGPM